MLLLALNLALLERLQVLAGSGQGVVGEIPDGHNDSSQVGVTPRIEERTKPLTGVINPPARSKESLLRLPADDVRGDALGGDELLVADFLEAGQVLLGFVEAGAVFAGEPPTEIVRGSQCRLVRFEGPQDFHGHHAVLFERAVELQRGPGGGELFIIVLSRVYQSMNSR